MDLTQLPEQTKTRLLAPRRGAGDTQPASTVASVPEADPHNVATASR